MFCTFLSPFTLGKSSSFYWSSLRLNSTGSNNFTVSKVSLTMLIRVTSLLTFPVFLSLIFFPLRS